MIFLCSKQLPIQLSGDKEYLKVEEIQLCSTDDILEYFDSIPNSWIAVDTETKGRDPHVKEIITLQLGTPEHQYVIDCRYYDIKIFKDLLEKRNLILHNSKFDYKFLKAAGITIESIYDTMLAECVIFCGYKGHGYGLKALCERYCNVHLNKDVRGEFFLVGDKPFTTTQILYAATDVKHLHDIKDQQAVYINKYDLNHTIWLENNAVKALADIEFNGMFLDKNDWLKIADDSEKKFDEITLELDTIVLNDPILSNKIPKNKQLDLFAENVRETMINYSSPMQILRIINMLGFEVEDTSDRSLSKIANKHDFIKKLQEYREVKTIVERYGRSFSSNINRHTGRIHTDFWQVLNTGRISSGNDEMSAPNLQNIPADNKFRNCFKARPGFLWVSVDYSSQELRLMADGSKEKAFIDVINSGEDLHCYAGSIMFKRTITKADKDLRNKAKTINFGKPLSLAA